MSQLIPLLHRTQWRPAALMLEQQRLDILLDVLDATSIWKAPNNVAHILLEILEILSLASFTHVPLCEVKLSTGRTGLGLILETASLSTDVSTIISALKVLVNMSSLEVELANTDGNYSTMINVPNHRKHVWEYIRNNDGIRTLIGLLRSANGPRTDTIRLLVCRILIGLAQDPGLNQILRAVDIPIILSDLFKEPLNSEQASEFKSFKEVALRLIGMVTGRADHIWEARDNVMVRLEKAAIVANTNITYNDNELHRLIYDHLKSRGLHETAEALQRESAHMAKQELHFPISLDNIVTSYLRHQHRECMNPITTLPPVSLLKPHKCYVPPPSTTSNLITRLRQREMGDSRFSRHINAKHLDRKYIYGRFRYVGAFRDEEAGSITCNRFCPRTGRLYLGTDYGDLLVFKNPEMIESRTNDLSESSTRYSLNRHITGLCPSNDGKLLLSWFGETFGIGQNSCVKLYHTDKLDADQCMNEWPGIKNALFSHQGQMIVGTNQKETIVWDVDTAKSIAVLTDHIIDFHDQSTNIACFDPYDELVLSDGVLWDIRNPENVIHRFDRFSRSGATGVFHPNGNEIIIDSEVWDVRTFGLLRTVPYLKNTRSITFSPNNDVMYAIYHNNNNNNHSKKNLLFDDVNDKNRQRNMFRTIDAVSYQPLATIDLEREVNDLSPFPNGNFVAVVMEDAQADSSTCRLYEIGRKKRGDDDEYDSDSMSDDDDDSEDDSEDEDESFSDESDELDDLDDLSEGGWEELMFDDFERNRDNEDDEDDDEDNWVDENEEEEGVGWVDQNVVGVVNNDNVNDGDDDEWMTDDEEDVS
ncbi:hypothetical protein AKO1_003638, partial [Acrasis kona]